MYNTQITSLEVEHLYYVCQTDNLGTRVALLINVERIDAVSGNGVL